MLLMWTSFGIALETQDARFEDLVWRLTKLPLLIFRTRVESASLETLRF